MTFTRISDDELARICDEEGFPSVGDELAQGKTQEEATEYMVGVPVGGSDDDTCYYDDVGGRWLKEYVEQLHQPRCAQCDTPMNPVQAMIGPVCGKCCKRNHAAVAGRS